MFVIRARVRGRVCLSATVVALVLVATTACAVKQPVEPVDPDPVPADIAETPATVEPPPEPEKVLVSGVGTIMTTWISPH